ncbi:MAG TPA: hypothetical protein VEH76_07955 [Methylocystis sp.]|nr:hypothetical protein [Methylocystis sp.]
MSDMDESGRDAVTDRPRTSPATLREKPVAALTDGPMPPSLSTIAAQNGLERRVTNLSAAITRARLDNAERASAIADLRGAEIARLEILRDQLDPILAQLPKDCDLFDVAVSPSERPRLFIDSIGFVEMGRDRRAYRFLQDTRYGRRQVCESERPENLVEAITAYIAHRLVEREKALATDYASGSGAAEAARTAARQAVAKAPVSRDPGAGRRRAMQVYLFSLEVIGSIATFGLLFLLAAWLIKRLSAS